MKTKQTKISLWYLLKRDRDYTQNFYYMPGTVHQTLGMKRLTRQAQFPKKHGRQINKVLHIRCDEAADSPGPQALEAHWWEAVHRGGAGGHFSASLVVFGFLESCECIASTPK